MNAEDLTLDQMRMVVAIVQEGSFSAAAARLGRVQSAVSHGVRKAEEALGLTLFDRKQRKVALTDVGRSLLPRIQAVLASVGEVMERSAAMRAGLEPEVSVVFDQLVPTDGVVSLVRAFEARFPSVQLRIGIETLGAVLEAITSGGFQLGVVSPAARVPASFEQRFAGEVRMVPVVAPSHPLGQQKSVGLADTRSHVQVVLSERMTDHHVEDVAVVANRTWRVADLQTKRALLRAGLGFGNLPEPMVREDLAAGRLVRLPVTFWGENEHLLSLRAVVHDPNRLGQAGRWVLDNLGSLSLTWCAP